MPSKTKLSISQFAERLFFSDVINSSSETSVIKYQWNRFVALWNNDLEEKSNAIGIERFLKLFLVLIQYLFLGFYVRAIFNRWGDRGRSIGIELYVLFKITTAILILSFQPFDWGTGWSLFFKLWVPYMITESVLYTAALIFCSDIFSKPRSYKRNLILLLFDYTEITVGFASLYLINNALIFTNQTEQITKQITSLDAAYFSFVTSVTVGYGDIAVATQTGKVLTILQILVFLLYGVLFLNFYATRIEERGNLVPDNKNSAGN